MDERVKKIFISGKKGKGKFVLVDAEDYEKYGGKKWHLNSYGYATRAEYPKNEHYKRVYLHREIMNCPKGMVVDHLNGDKLDCRKKNMRVCTDAENHKNRHDNAKHYTFDKNKGKWRVIVKGVCYGSYLSEEEAAKIARKVVSGGKVDAYHRKFRLLPKYVYKNRGKYMFRKQLNGKEYYKGDFKTIKEAKEYADAFLKEHASN